MMMSASSVRAYSVRSGADLREVSLMLDSQSSTQATFFINWTLYAFMPVCLHKCPIMKNKTEYTTPFFRPYKICDLRNHLGKIPI